MEIRPAPDQLTRAIVCQTETWAGGFPLKRLLQMAAAQLVMAEVPPEGHGDLRIWALGAKRVWLPTSCRLPFEDRCQHPASISSHLIGDEGQQGAPQQAAFCVPQPQVQQDPAPCLCCAGLRHCQAGLGLHCHRRPWGPCTSSSNAASRGLPPVPQGQAVQDAESSHACQ